MKLLSKMQQGATGSKHFHPLPLLPLISSLPTYVLVEFKPIFGDPVCNILLSLPLLFETSICAHTRWSQLRFVFLIRHRSVIATLRFTVCPPTLSNPLDFCRSIIEPALNPPL